MDIKKGTKLKLRWQFLNEGEPVLLSDYSKFRLDVLDGKKVPQRTSVTLVDNEVAFTIDTAKYETGRFSVRVDADGADGGLHVCHRDAFRIVPANVKSSLAKGGNGENYELTVKDDLVGQTQTSASAKWGKITGQIAEQEDLMGKLRDKQDKLIDQGTGQNIKTLNGESLLGVGDLLAGGIKKLPIVGGGTGDDGQVDLARLTSGVYATEGWGDAIVFFTFGDKTFQFEGTSIFIVAAWNYPSSPDKIFDIIVLAGKRDSYTGDIIRIVASTYDGNEWGVNYKKAFISDIGSLTCIQGDYSVIDDRGGGILAPGTYSILYCSFLTYAYDDHDNPVSLNLGKGGILTVTETGEYNSWTYIGPLDEYNGRTAFVKYNEGGGGDLAIKFIDSEYNYGPPTSDNEIYLPHGNTKVLSPFSSDATLKLYVTGNYDNFIEIFNFSTSDDITISVGEAYYRDSQLETYSPVTAFAPASIKIGPGEIVKLTVVNGYNGLLVTASEPLAPVNA